MSSAPLTKFAAKTAAEVCTRFEPGDDAKALAKDGQTPAQFLDGLLAASLHQDAIRFLAQGLPKREAVWWACVCAKAVSGAQSPPQVEAAIAAAEAWVREPTDERARAAKELSDAAKLETPAGCAALAAFFSGSSLAPPDVPAVPPADNLTGHAVAGAVMLAGVVSEPEKAAEKYERFLAQGIDLANGRRAGN